MSDCCATKAPTALPVSCPMCQARGRAVPDETPVALLRDSARDRLGPGPHHYCRTPTCLVVYFSAAGQVFVKDDLRVRVGGKETAPPIPLCYCFGHTVETIEDEIQSKGTSTVLERIRAEVKAGTCRCERENPQGSCCLGDVARTVKALLERRSMGSDTGDGQRG